MSRKLLVLNNSLLFLCTSIYLGTGWSLVLFSFPLAPQLTPDTYSLPFVLPVENATRFFTYMTSLMFALLTIMLISEWRTRFRWVPIVVLAAVVAATALTIVFIFPHNHEMETGITDPARLQLILGKWMTLNTIRTSLWTVEWLAMMAYFAMKSSPAERS